MRFANHRMQCCSGHVLHAQQSYATIGDHYFREYLHNVVMLQPSHGQAFVSAVGSHLECDAAVERFLTDSRTVG